MTELREGDYVTIGQGRTHWQIMSFGDEADHAQLRKVNGRMEFRWEELSRLVKIKEEQ